MIWQTIVTVVVVLLLIAVIVLSYYLYIKNKIMKEINTGIDDVEDTDKTGEEKMKTVVSMLSSIVPTVLKPFITDKMLTTLVQAAFDKIESYAEKQAKKQAQNDSAEENK